jgi:phage antirepressor YoqD-like protein
MTLNKPKRAHTLKEKAMALSYENYIATLMDEYDLWDHVEFLGNLNEDELIAQGYLALQRKLAARTAELGRANEVIAELAPKAAYYDAVAGSEGDKSFRETAKTFGVPEKKFIAFLIDHGYVYRDARGTLTPYADHMKRGQFTVREIVYNGAETIRTSSQTRITPKGRQVIWRAMEKDGLITL